MKSDHIEGQSSFAPVRMIGCTLCPILPASSCISISQWDSMGHSGHKFFRSNHTAPPSTPHQGTKLAVIFCMSCNCCCSALNESLPWKLYFATLGGYLWLVCPCALPNPSPVACCLTFLSCSPPELRSHIASTISQSTVAESILQYPNFPKAARSQKSRKNLQPPTPSAGVHLTALCHGSVPGISTDTSSRRTQPPILSSTCWRH